MCLSFPCFTGLSSAYTSLTTYITIHPTFMPNMLNLRLLSVSKTARYWPDSCLENNYVWYRLG